MKLEKVLPVESHDGSALANREQEDFAVWPRQPRLPRIANRQDVMPHSAELLDRRLGKVFVRKEAGHNSGGLIFLDLLLDEIAVAHDEGPGVREILGSKRRIGAQKICIAGAAAAGLLEHPDRDPGADDAGNTS